MATKMFTIPRRTHHSLPLLRPDELYRRAFAHCDLPAGHDDDGWLAQEVALRYLRDYCRPDDMGIGEFYQDVQRLYPWLSAHARRQADSDYVRRVLVHEERPELAPA